MKQTRRLQIRQRIFRIDDLKRIAGVFDEQARLARKSKHHHAVAYTLNFADDSSFESDTPALLGDTVVEIKRPVKVEFGFFNYKLERRMSFSITYGQSDSGNEFLVRANEGTWLNDNFTKLESFVNGAELQSFWFVRHPSILKNLLALGVGTLGMILVGIFVSFLSPPALVLSQSNLTKLKALWVFSEAHQAGFYLIGWFGRWLAGWFWGAVPIANWLLSAWPNIDLDFGSDHLKLEKRRREKIVIVITLIVVPILLTIIQDIIKKTI